ncbi:c-type heme family protein [Calothrix sp. CCY 0018]|uniref:c-type heme family protein n=1 Tax=Calothrix sp. CCY 0018 TaxID=3103864 RepID=UPI0039C72D14
MGKNNRQNASTSETAPKSLIATYEEQSFGWKLNDIMATQIVFFLRVCLKSHK